MKKSITKQRLEMLRRLLIAGLFVGLTMIFIAAALPHTHHPMSTSSMHQCVLCCAQSVHPDIDPPLVVGFSFLLFLGMAICVVSPLFLQNNLFVSESRAPPLYA